MSLIACDGFCPGVRVHKGITIVLSLFRSHWLAVVYCLVLCSCSCEPVHEDNPVMGLIDFTIRLNQSHMTLSQLR